MKRILYMISLLCLGLLSTGCDSEEQPGGGGKENR